MIGIPLFDFYAARRVGAHTYRDNLKVGDFFTVFDEVINLGYAEVPISSTYVVEFIYGGFIYFSPLRGWALYKEESSLPRIKLPNPESSKWQTM